MDLNNTTIYETSAAVITDELSDAEEKYWANIARESREGDYSVSGKELEDFVASRMAE